MNPKISQQNELYLAFTDPYDDPNLAKTLLLWQTAISPNSIPKEHIAQAKETGLEATRCSSGKVGVGGSPLSLYILVHRMACCSR